MDEQINTQKVLRGVMPLAAQRWMLGSTNWIEPPFLSSPAPAANNSSRYEYVMKLYIGILTSAQGETSTIVPRHRGCAIAAGSAR